MQTLDYYLTSRFRRRGMSIFRRVVSSICLALLIMTVGFAQGTRGTIRGLVTDPNGAVIAGATVTLIDVARDQEVRTVVSNEKGEYQFLEIEPAVYNIVIKATGFTEARLSEVKVEPNRNLQLDASLSVGGTTVEVTVTGTQELLDHETPTLGSTVDRRRVQDLPLNGRNILDLALIQPGVVEANQNTTGTAATVGVGSGVRVHGNRGVENNLTLDGSNNNEVAAGGAMSAQPRPDAVQEFRILTNNFEAEFGRNTGSIINVVVNSGTNEYHGNARLYYRPTKFSAARFFDKALAPVAVQGTDAVKRRFERKEFGGNIGGPLYLPRFGEGGRASHLGKNRSFFFIDYEGRRQLIGDTRTISNLPTPEERQGIFTRSAASATSLPILLLDPATNLPFPIISGNNVAGGTVRQQIPAERFINNPIAQFYTGFLPVADANGTARAGADELTSNDYLTARLDFIATDSQTFNFTFNRFQGVLENAFAAGANASQLPGFGTLDLRKTYNAALRHTFTLSPTVVNSFLAGYARNDFASGAPHNKATVRQIGFQRDDFVAVRAFEGPPLIRLYDRNDLRIGNTVQGPQARVTENFQIQDSLSWATGDHRFKFGFDGTQYRGQQTFAFINNGGLLFSSQFGGNTSGNDFADFLLGNPAFVQVGNSGDLDFRQNAIAAFAQDTWRLSDQLTLSLGLRYEYNSPIYDKFDRVVFYRPGSNVTSQRLTSGSFVNFEGYNVTIPPGGRAPQGVIYVGDPDPVLGTAPRGGVRPDRNNFAPRFGFAYSPEIKSVGLLQTILGNRRTVFRGGIGINYGAVVGDVALQQLGAPGYGTLVTQLFTDGAGTAANPFGPDPFPNYVGPSGRDNPAVLDCAAPDVICNATPLTNPLTAPRTISAPLLSFPLLVVDPEIRTPYVISTNFTIERGIGADHVLSLSYVGNRGRKLYGQSQVNPGLGTFFPFAAGDPRRTLVPTAGNINQRRLNGDVRTGITMQVSGSNSSYDAFEANLQKRMSYGLLYQIAYTFSKSINESESVRGGLDLLDRRFGRGLSDDDVPHRLVVSWIYDIQFARQYQGILKTLLDGWSIGGIATFQSGTPVSVFNNFDEAASGGIVSFADLGAPFQEANPLTEDRRAFNVDAFRSFCNPATDPVAKCFRRGTSARNQLRVGNDVNNFDLILSKKTRLWSESSNLELRLEAFNVFNHTQFTTVDLSLTNRTGSNTNPSPNSGFGKFTGARESRIIQFGARFSF
jgi:Carboxypeptidase regulatory-like domain